MADREIVITHLQIIHTWAEFARERDLQFFTAKHLKDIAKWSDDAIAMLKELEADIKNLNEIIANILQKITEMKMIYGDCEYVGELVRCKDCRYGQYCTDGETTYQCFKWNSNEFGALHEQDWYCADGQR